MRHHRVEGQFLDVLCSRLMSSMTRRGAGPARRPWRSGRLKGGNRRAARLTAETSGDPQESGGTVVGFLTPRLTFE